MGGRRVAIEERPTALIDKPLTSVQGAGGLWSFDIHGSATAETVLILLPAMGVPAHYYEPLAKELLNAGVAVVRADFLADDVRLRSPGEPNGFAALVEGCVPSIVAAIAEYLPRAAPVIVGHSLGGQLGLIAAARFAPETPVVLAASGSAWHRTFEGNRGWVYLGGSQAIRNFARLVGHWPGDRLGFGGRQPEAVIGDWARVVRTGRYAAATGTFDYETVLADYRGDLLAIDVAGDVLAPRTATDALIAKVPQARVTRLDYSPARGTTQPGAHFTWVRDRPGLAGVVLAWVRTLSP